MAPTKARNIQRFNYPYGYLARGGLAADNFDLPLFLISCLLTPLRSVPSATTLQQRARTPYSRPYVAEYSHSDYAFDPGDRLHAADSCRADAATEKRRIGSSLRQQHDGKYFRCSDRDGVD
ncbi:MAG: hypothetical protein QOG92_1602 [Verrucomicrobiota bacterium]|nr:hypothetical protein [Verrucomicrobiota bacterium]